MSKKYIIEIEEEPATKDGVELWKACGFNALVFDQNGLDRLTDLEDKLIDFDLAYDEAYQNGLDDAWEAAKKLVWETSVEELEMMGLLGKNETCESGKVLEKHTAAEAIAKLKEYEQRQKSIQVGDEVTMGKASIGIVTRIFYDCGHHYNVVWSDGNTGFYGESDLKRTGRHFPEIQQALERIMEIG